jgi:hypothetical protein
VTKGLNIATQSRFLERGACCAANLGLDKLPLALALIAALGLHSAALAHHKDHKSDNYTVTTGYGDGIKVQQGPLGKQTVIQDRLGDKYVHEKGVFGENQAVNVLGNKYMKHKGVGGTQLEASDMFGDKIESRKALHGFGRRQTDVNLSGVTGIAQGLFANKLGQRSSLVDLSAFPNPTAPALPSDVATAGTSAAVANHPDPVASQAADSASTPAPP